MQIALLETGGTINGILGPDDPAPTDSRVLAWLEQNSTRLDIKISADILLMKDSRAITDKDRAYLAEAIEASKQDHILIAHGTYTMPDTGVFLRKHLSEAAQQKTIVLVGSLVPLNDPDSDAPASLEFAIRSLRSGNPGVWIAMNQKAWHPAEVIKDKTTGNYVGRNSLRL